MYAFKMPVSGGTPVRLSDRVALSPPILSNDGRHIAFISQRPDGKVVAANISAETGDLELEKDIPPTYDPNGGACWMPDNRHVAIVDLRTVNWLESQGVEFIEQPMPASMLEETRWLRSRVHIPILADEACLNSAAIPKLVDAYDGVNVKLDKTGGTLEALRTIAVARAFGMKVMLGCMVSSSVTVTAAAHLSPLVDYADLDGNLLIANDPFIGVQVAKGKLILPDGAGLGLHPAESLR